MYSLLIAEDELLMRRSLVNLMKWSEMGFRVDGVFSDGQELLEYLKTNVPDVILTDIKMSRVSGLEIARFVSEQNLPIQVVFLSGYRDFDFAQSALEYKVAHYLVKPVSVPKLREVFMGLKEILDRQSSLQNAMLDRVEHYQKLINYQKQQFVIDAWTGTLDNEKKAEKRLQLLTSRLHNGAAPRLLLIYVMLQNDTQYRRFLADYGVQELQEQAESILGALNERMEYYSIEWKVSGTGRGLAGLGVFWEKTENETTEMSWMNSQQLMERFQKEIEDLTGIHAELKVLKEMDSPAELISGGGLLTNVKPTEAPGNTGIENVMSYIQEHYCEDITLSDIAEKVYLNPIYISRLIKEHMGKNYTELLMELRVEKAVDLLKNTDMYVYEIAEVVGYGNLKYFYKIFKRVKGKSPNDFRKKE